MTPVDTSTLPVRGREQGHLPLYFNGPNYQSLTVGTTALWIGGKSKNCPELQEHKCYPYLFPHKRWFGHSRHIGIEGLIESSHGNVSEAVVCVSLGTCSGFYTELPRDSPGCSCIHSPRMFWEGTFFSLWSCCLWVPKTETTDPLQQESPPPPCPLCLQILSSAEEKLSKSSNSY